MCSEKQVFQKFYKHKLVHGRMYDGESAQEKISKNSPAKDKNFNKISFDFLLVLFWYILIFIESPRRYIISISFFQYRFCQFIHFIKKHSSHEATFTRINRENLVCCGYASYIPELKDVCPEEEHRLHLYYNYRFGNENKMALTMKPGIVAFGGITEYFLIKRNSVLVNAFEICD